MTPAAPEPTRIIVPLTQPEPRAMRAAMLQAAQAGADLVEVRLDHLADTCEEALRCVLADPPCPVLATCRSRAEGGAFAGTAEQQAALLRRAAALGAAWVDVELSLLPQAPAMLGPPGAGAGAGVVLSAHDFRGRPDLPALLARMAAEPAAVSKVAFAAAGPEDAWFAFDALRDAAARGRPTIALAMGEHGVASRILARRFGAFGTFAALAAGAESAPGQPTIADLRGLYRWDAIGPRTQVFGVIGCPVGHSMSPAIHNAAFAADGVDAVYVPLRIEPGAEAFHRFIDAVLQRPWAGLAGVSVTIPHKENALARVGPDGVDALSRAIGAINTIRFTGDANRPMVGCNTDYAAAIDALVDAMGCTREDLAGREVAVLGAGGAARAIVAALAHYGAQVSVYNRTVARAEQLADEFGGPRRLVRARGADALDAAGDAEIVINCTPIGMHPVVDACPLPEGFAFRPDMVVFDTIYNPVQTRLLRRAAEADATCVTGVEMFVNQAAAQYETWLERPAPREVMRDVVLRRLGAVGA